jgi:transposase
VAVIEALVPVVRSGGRPEKHPKRAAVNAIFYMVRSGCSWRQLPHDFPPWQTVFWYFKQWRAEGTTDRLHDALRDRVRDRAGRGRKRHIVVDTMGLLLAVIITTAGVQDRDGARTVLDRLRFTMPSVVQVWADGGYAGKLLDWARHRLRIGIQIVRKPLGITTFQVLPRRWVVERTFAWIVQCRRLAHDYERLPEHSDAMIKWAMIALMTRRISPTPGRRLATFDHSLRLTKHVLRTDSGCHEGHLEGATISRRCGPLRAVRRSVSRVGCRIGAGARARPAGWSRRAGRDRGRGDLPRHRRHHARHVRLCQARRRVRLQLRERPQRAARDGVHRDHYAGDRRDPAAEGSANSARGAACLVADAIKTTKSCGVSGLLVLRGDSAYYTRDVIAAAGRHGVRFSITARKDEAVTAAIAAIPEQAWTTIKYPRAVFDEQLQQWVSDAEVAEVPFTAFASRPKAQRVSARLIVRRVRDQNPDHVQRNAQGELFRVWRHHAVFTDSLLPMLHAEADHRRHAIIAQVDADLKNGPLAHLPSGKFAANSA